MARRPYTVASAMKHVISTVLRNRPVARDYREILFRWDGERPLPGSFLTIKPNAAYDPLLRRPFAFSSHDAQKKEAGFIFQIRGRATEGFAALGEGAAIDILGPLGSGFPETPDGSSPILVAGGIGIGPMLYQAQSLSASARAGKNSAPVLVMGFRSAEFVPSGLALPENTVICTDDGSAGFRGNPLMWLESLTLPVSPVMYACGPTPMIAALDTWSAQKGIRLFVTAEQWMACGIGACMGCAIRLKAGGYTRACADGPVFDASLIDWEA